MARRGGPVFVLDSVKAPSWTIPASLDFVAAASAPRKTIVFGTISDYSGSASKNYRRAAKQALAFADRVIFVGPHSGHGARLKKADARDRLFAFQTSYEASVFLAQHSTPDELIFVKGSGPADHLERIALSQVDGVVCWRERCGKRWHCIDCKLYRQPSPPPFAASTRPKLQSEAS